MVWFIRRHYGSKLCLGIERGGILYMDLIPQHAAGMTMLTQRYG